MEIELGIGNRTQTVNIPEQNDAVVLVPNNISYYNQRHHAADADRHSDACTSG